MGKFIFYIHGGVKTRGRLCPLSGGDIIAGGWLLNSFVESLSQYYWPEEEEILLEKKSESHRSEVGNT